MVSPETRRHYADEIRATAKIGSEALLDAFSTVPREDFVGPGPWKVLSRPAPGQMQPHVTDVSDPCELYRDVAVYLDSSKSLTNGNPSTLAPWLNALDLAEGKSVFHLGCGTGYYTAIIAEVVGPRGQVTAAEIDPALASQARQKPCPLSERSCVGGGWRRCGHWSARRDSHQRRSDSPYRALAR
jgi:protein-L-isoaspartate(D-aspartate) O-methyltransferase